MRINSNTHALNSLRNIIKTKHDLLNSIEKLSSGQKINKASDDPAGLIISEKMRAKIGEIEQELKNIEYTDNKYSTAESTLGSLQNNLREMRNIAIAAANEGGNSDEVQNSLQQSLDNTAGGYNTMLESATFGTQKLLDGSQGSVANVSSLQSPDVSTPEKAQQAIETIDAKIDEISSLRGEIGAKQKNELGARRNNLETELVNITAAESSIRDTDMAREYINYISQEIRLKAEIAMLAQGNQIPNLVLNFLEK
jgi:flagellin